MSGPTETTDVVSLSIHGPVGVVDLIVPVGASGVDVAGEYSRVAGLASPPLLYTRLGRLLDPQSTLADAEVRSGAVLVAVPVEPDSRGPRTPRGSGGRAATEAPVPGPISVLWFAVASATALVAGWLTAHLPDDDGLRTVTIVVLLGSAMLSAVPLGPRVDYRAQAAPCFAGAAAFAIVWDPTPERLPTILGISALVAAVAAGVCRALDSHHDEGLRVWMWGGVLLFALTTGAALVDAPSALVWALLLVVAMLSSRFVPMMAIDVPDQFLLDLERLAVTAWSARDRPTGRRTRIIVPRQRIAEVAAGGARMTTAAAVAIMVIMVVSAPLLLRETSVSIDHWGARAVVLFSGAAVLLTARSYRHAGARGLLRVAGLWAVGVVVGDLLLGAGDGVVVLVAFGAISLALMMFLIAVALGRGWRSAWWSRRAEVAESVSGAFAMGAVVVASGLVREVWKLIG